MGKFQKSKRISGTSPKDARADPLASFSTSAVLGKVKGSRLLKGATHESDDLDDVWAPSTVEEAQSPFAFTSAFALDTAAAKTSIELLRSSILQVGTGAARAAGQDVASVHIDTAAMDDVEMGPVVIPVTELKSSEQRKVSEDRAMTKVARRKQRREKFLQKLSSLEKSKKKHADIAHKKAHPHVVVGDLTTLQDALSTVEKSTAKKPNKVISGDSTTMKMPAKSPKVALPKRIAAVMRAQVNKSTRKTTSKRGRSHALALETSNFKDVLAHAHFKINPVATIKDHVKNSVAADRSAMDVLYPGQEDARLKAIRLALKVSKSTQAGSKSRRRIGVKVGNAGKTGMSSTSRPRFNVGNVTPKANKRKSARSKVAKRK